MSIEGHLISRAENGALDYIAPPSIKLRRMWPEFVKMPTYATAGAACFDLACYQGAIIERGQGHTFHTGLEVEIPEGFALLIYSRSGHGFRKGLRLANCTGIIDSDYRGELLVRLVNDDPDNAATIEDGERVAQAMMIPAPRHPILEVETLSRTTRGRNGFGSTGAT